LILGLACFLSRKRGWKYLAGLILLGLYLIVVIEEIFFPIPLPGNWPHNLTWKDTIQALSQINLIPFRYSGTYNSLSSYRPLLKDIIGNILLTIPVGLGFSFLTPLRGKTVIFLALGVGLTMEGIQLLMKLLLGVFYHVVDINDVLMNALGILAGYESYRLTSWIVSKAGSGSQKPAGKI
jgi:glycopeptide antibiotics resistance protein